MDVIGRPSVGMFSFFLRGTAGFEVTAGTGPVLPPLLACPDMDRCQSKTPRPGRRRPGLLRLHLFTFLGCVRGEFS